MNLSEMESNQAKKQFYDDRTQMLSILSKKNFDSNDSEDTLKSFIRYAEIKDSKFLDYDSIKDLSNLYRIKLNINSMIEKDLGKTVSIWTEYKARYLNDREDTFDSLYSDSVRFIEQRLIEKLKKIWNKIVTIENNFITINEKVQVDYNEYFIEETLKNLEQFSDFQTLLETLANDTINILNKSSQYLMKHEVFQNNSKLYIAEELTQENYSQSLSAIFNFLDHKLFQLAKTHKIFIKRLNFSELLQKAPEDFRASLLEFLQNSGFSFKQKTSIKNTGNFFNMLQEIRELALQEDLQLTEISERDIPNSISAAFTELVPETVQKSKISFSKIKVPNSVIRFIEILYRLLTPSASSEEILKIFPNVRLCIHLYLTTKSATIQKKSQINRFCMFFNTCKYLEYHLIVINSNILNKVDTDTAKSLHLSDFVYKIQQKIAVSFKKLQKKFEKQVLNDFHSCVEKQKLNVMKINEKLNKYEDYLKDIHDILCQDSCKVIGRLLDFIIISLKTVFSHMNAECSHLRPLLLTINSFSKFFPSGQEGQYAKQWSTLNELDNTQDLFN